MPTTAALGERFAPDSTTNGILLNIGLRSVLTSRADAGRRGLSLA